jgi:hypothetical protein
MWDFILPWRMVDMLSAPLTGLASVAGFVWIAACLYVIAKKTNTENPWLAWIPVANLVLACLIAGKPWWWGFLLAIPLVNLIIIEIVVWKICEMRNKPGWLALLMLVPVANMIIPGILAFAD